MFVFSKRSGPELPGVYFVLAGQNRWPKVARAARLRVPAASRRQHPAHYRTGYPVNAQAGHSSLAP